MRGVDLCANDVLIEKYRQGRGMINIPMAPYIFLDPIAPSMEQLEFSEAFANDDIAQSDSDTLAFTPSFYTRVLLIIGGIFDASNKPKTTRQLREPCGTFKFRGSLSI